MIVDQETLDLTSSIEGLLEALGDIEKDGEVKPELMESVCEIATEPCQSAREAGYQLRALRRLVQQVANERGAAIGSAGTHPFALWEDQRVVSRPRYRDLIAGLQFVARQEIIFGIHVHVGLDDPDKAIHVTNGMRVHVPILLALSANSPFWRGQHTGLHSTRTPIFRAFPRVGIPPRYEDYEDWSRADRVHDHGQGDPRLHLPLVRRPPPPELRHGRDAGDGLPDARGAHARDRRADPGDGQGAGRALRRGQVAVALPVRDARREQVARRPPRARGRAGRPAEDRPGRRRRAGPPPDERLRPHAEELGSADEFDGLEDILENGTGSARQIVVFDANHDLQEVVREIVDASVPEAAETAGE